MPRTNLKHKPELVHGPSMIPAGLSGTPEDYAEPKADKEPIPTLIDYLDAKDDAEDIAVITQLAEQSGALGAQIKALEEKRKVMSDRLKTSLGRYGITKVRCNDYTVETYPQTRSTVDPKLLMAHGVEFSTITACTKTSESLVLRVTAIRK